MADVTKTVAIIFQGQDRVSGSLAPIENSLQSIGEDADFAEQGLSGIGDEAAVLGTVGANNIGLLGKALAGLGLALSVDSFIEANVALEKFNQTMLYATGSTEEAAKEWEYVVSVADRFGLALTDTAGAYSKFIAGTAGGVLSTEQLKVAFEGVAGTLSLVGTSSSETAEALRQMTQGIGKNRFELEDLKSIAERVPGGMYGIADALDITTEALYKQITAGQFGAAEIAKYAETLNDKLAGVEFSSFTQELERLGTAWDELLIQFGDTGAFSAVTSVVGGIGDLIQNVGESFGTLNDLKFGSQILDDGTIEEIEKVVGKTQEWSILTGFFGNAWTDAATETKTAAGDINSALQEVQVTAQRIEPIKTDSFWDIGEDLRAVLDEEFIDPWEEAGQKLEAVDPFGGVRESAEKTAVQTQKATLELEKLASNERIANIEASVSLDIAQLEADASIVDSIMEGLSATVQSTGELLGSLFGNLTQADNLRQEFAIEDQIRLENKRREEALKLEQQIAEATIAKLKAETRRLNSGDPVITVNGDGLQPHLEAIMFELLEAIQVRVNADGYSMLLGV